MYCINVKIHSQIAVVTLRSYCFKILLDIKPKKHCYNDNINYNNKEAYFRLHDSTFFNH